MGKTKNKFEDKVSELLSSFFKQSTIDVDVESYIISVNDTELGLSFIVGSIGAVTELYPSEEVGVPEYVWILLGVSLCLILIIAGFLYKQRRDKLALIAKTMIIKNPMVIAISIGFYQQEMKAEDKEFETDFRDLKGVRIDIDNIIKFFGQDGLNYDIYPSTYYDETVDNYKAIWNEVELKEFLQSKAHELENNLNDNDEESPDRYDGLLVFVSCHGLEGYIVTSDYKKFSKTAIHRIFSGKNPECRKIPRLFLFDCGSGPAERDTDWRAMEDDSKSDVDVGKDAEHMELNKIVSIEDITRQNSEVWMLGEDNPDYQLAVIMAANDGFQAKMSKETGSYVITQFIERLSDNYDNDNDKFLNDILHQVQDDLHNRGKQLPIMTFNNRTGFIKFEENKVMTGDGMVEMTTNNN